MLNLGNNKIEDTKFLKVVYTGMIESIINVPNVLPLHL